MAQFTSNIIGNERVSAFLGQSLEQKRLSHAYCLFGPRSVGKNTLAREFARAILCSGKNNVIPCNVCKSCAMNNNHPDVLALGSEEPIITIEETREFINKLNTSPFIGAYRIGIIDGAHRLNAHAQHALLKTLEEPATQTILLLISEIPLLATIASRVQNLYLRTVSPKKIIAGLVDRGVSLEQATIFAKKAHGSPGRAIQLLASIDLQEEDEQNENFCKKLLNGELEFNALNEHIEKELLVDARKRLMTICEKSQWLLRNSLLKSIGCASDNETNAPYKKFPAPYAMICAIDRLHSLRRAIYANVDPRLILENFYLS